MAPLSGVRCIILAIKLSQFVSATLLVPPARCRDGSSAPMRSRPRFLIIFARV
jgi:hypothetical protein